MRNIKLIIICFINVILVLYDFKLNDNDATVIGGKILLVH